MSDDEQTETAAPSMDDLIRGRRADYQRAVRERLLPSASSSPSSDDDHDDDDDGDA